MSTDNELIERAKYLAERLDESFKKSHRLEDANASMTINALVRLVSALEGVTPTEKVARDHEPPLGTWVKDKYGSTSQRRIDVDGRDGWGQPGFYSFGKWPEMWDARGPLTICGPWGASVHERSEQEAQK